MIEGYRAKPGRPRTKPDTPQVARDRERSRRHQAELKDVVFGHYSGGEPRCACCGEDDLGMLCIDHIMGGGTQESSHGFKLWCSLKRRGFPTGYRVLCANCNLSASTNLGICNHQKTIQHVLTGGFVSRMTW